MRPSLRHRSPARLSLAIAASALVAGASFADASEQPASFRGSRLIAKPAAAGWCDARGAGSGGIPLEGKQLVLKSSSNPKKNSFLYRSEKKQEPLASIPNPADAGFAVLVRGTDDAADRSELALLDDASLWKPIGKSGGWKYKDKTGAKAGIRTVILKNGQVTVVGKGENWLFAPDGTAGEEVTVHVQIGSSSYCSTFGGTVQRNEEGLYKARDAGAPGACAVQMCGNKIQEVGEVCDDGNLSPLDGCGNDCLEAPCVGETFDSTFEAIQKTVLDPYGCTSSLCHGKHDVNGDPDHDPPHESGLELLPAEAAALPAGNPQGLASVLARNHAALLNSAPANNLLYDHFVVQGDSKTSLLYQALYKKVHCVGNPNAPAECEDLASAVEAMPEGIGEPILPEQLEAIDLWIRGTAPLDEVVIGTADKLGACLPPAKPGKIDPIPAPASGEGVQFRSSAWPLPADSENEVCFPTWYDFTTVIPEEQWIDCPDALETNGPLNADNKCFKFDRQLLVQDPQSHHSIIHIYTGEHGTSDADWGAWTHKGNALDDPQNGQPCDPLAIDPATGWNEGCSGEPVRSPACVFYGPPDFSAGGFSLPGMSAVSSPQFSGSQETHYDQPLPENVYSVLPLKGIVVWNSHAFNLTQFDTTMNQYLNLSLADATDQHRTRQIFDAQEIFWTNGIPLGGDAPSVAPFTAREICSSYTAPEGAHIFWLSSHTHRHGVRWRTFGPPNTPCTSEDTECVAPESNDRLIYYSTVYNDPLQLEIDPPLVMDSPNAADRTFLFCALYDNGSTPSSPSVKRHSASPLPPDIFGFTIGGPCPVEEKACISSNPVKRGQLCNAAPDPDAFCTTPGFQGYCDACPVRGGFSTEDEMFILLGNFFVP